MPQFDIEKRNFFKQSLLGLGLLTLNFSGLSKLAKASDNPEVGDDDFALLYSTATGIVLRTINPGAGEQHHLDWLEENKPEGTTLLRIKKRAVGADHKNCPNIDMMIPYVRQHHRIELKFGQPHHHLDENKNFVHQNIVCCPVLYRKNIPITHNLIPAHLPGISI